MRHVESRSNDSCYYFALEQYLAETLQDPEPVFLLWSTCPTLMLGHYQNPYEEIDLDYARRQNIRLVRRASGGGTIYTDPGSFQFSYIRRSAGEKIEFRDFLEPLLAALRKLGLDVAFNGRNDLVLQERKFSGNAQYKRNGYTVHHGSILFDCDLDEMARATRLPAYKIRSKGISSVRSRVINLREAMPRDMSRGDFYRYLMDELGGKDILELSAQDEAEIERLSQYYADEDLLFEQSPRADVLLERPCEGGTLRLELVLVQGKIDAIRLGGDYFAGENGAAVERELRQSLVGRCFSREEMNGAAHQIEMRSGAAGSEIFYKICWGDLLSMLREAFDAGGYGDGRATACGDETGE